MNMIDIETKLKQGMRKLGCESQHKIDLGFHLYLYLVEHKLMHDTECCYNKDIDTVYLVARPTKNSKLNIYVPLPSSDDLSLEFITQTQEKLCTPETGPTVHLAFIDAELATVVYTFTNDT